MGLEIGSRIVNAASLQGGSSWFDCTHFAGPWARIPWQLQGLSRKSKKHLHSLGMSKSGIHLTGFFHKDPPVGSKALATVQANMWQLL